MTFSEILTGTVADLLLRSGFFTVTDPTGAVFTWIRWTSTIVTFFFATEMINTEYRLIE